MQNKFGTYDLTQITNFLFVSLFYLRFKSKYKQSQDTDQRSKLLKETSTAIIYAISIWDKCLSMNDIQQSSKEIKIIFLFNTVIWIFEEIYLEYEKDKIMDKIYQINNKLEKSIKPKAEYSQEQCTSLFQHFIIKRKSIDDYINKYSQKFVNNQEFLTLFKQKERVGWLGLRQKQIDKIQSWFKEMNNLFFKFFLGFMVIKKFTTDEEINSLRDFVEFIFSNGRITHLLPKKNDRILFCVLLISSLWKIENPTVYLTKMKQTIETKLQHEYINPLLLNLCIHIWEDLPMIQIKTAQQSKTTVMSVPTHPSISPQPIGGEKQATQVIPVQIQPKQNQSMPLVQTPTISQQVRSYTQGVPTLNNNPNIQQPSHTQINQVKHPFIEDISSPPQPHNTLTRATTIQTPHRQQSKKHQKKSLSAFIPTFWNPKHLQSEIYIPKAMINELANLIIGLYERELFTSQEQKAAYLQMSSISKSQQQTINKKKKELDYMFLLLKNMNQTILLNWIKDFVIPLLNLIKKNNLPISYVIFVLTFIKMYKVDVVSLLPKCIFDPTDEEHEQIMQCWNKNWQPIIQTLQTTKPNNYQEIISQVQTKKGENACDLLQRIIRTKCPVKKQQQKIPQSSTVQQQQQQQTNPSTVQQQQQQQTNPSTVQQQQQQQQQTPTSIVQQPQTTSKKGVFQHLKQLSKVFIKRVGQRGKGVVQGIGRTRDALKNRMTRQLNERFLDPDIILNRKTNSSNDEAKTLLQKIPQLIKHKFKENQPYTEWVINGNNITQMSQTFQIQYTDFVATYIRWNYIVQTQPIRQRHFVLIHKYTNNILELCVLFPPSEEDTLSMLKNPQSFQKLPRFKMDFSNYEQDVKDLLDSHLTKIIRLLSFLFWSYSKEVFRQKILNFYTMDLKVSQNIIYLTISEIINRWGLTHQNLELTLGLKDLIIQAIRLLVFDLFPSAKLTDQTINQKKRIPFSKTNFKRKMFDLLHGRKKKYNIPVNDLILMEANSSVDTTKKELLATILKRYNKQLQKDTIVSFSKKQEDALKSLIYSSEKVEFPYVYKIGSSKTISFSKTYVVSTMTRTFILKDSFKVKNYECHFGRVVKFYFKKSWGGEEQYCVFLLYGLATEGIVLSADLTSRHENEKKLNQFYRNLFDGKQQQNHTPLYLHNNMVFSIDFKFETKIKTSSQQFYKYFKHADFISSITNLLKLAGVDKISRWKLENTNYFKLIQSLDLILQHASFWLSVLYFIMFPTYREIYGFKNEEIKVTACPFGKPIFNTLQKQVNVLLSDELKELIYSLLSVVLYGFMA